MTQRRFSVRGKNGGSRRRLVRPKERTNEDLFTSARGVRNWLTLNLIPNWYGVRNFPPIRVPETLLLAFKMM